MKKMLSTVMMGMICFSLVGCTKNSIEIGDESKYMLSDNLVSIEVKAGSLTTTKATLILENHTSDNYIYGNSYSIEYQKNGVWHKIIPKGEMNFNMKGYILKSNDSREISINWENSYGKLPSGKYRIIKEISVESEQLEEPIDMENFTPSEIIYISGDFIIE